MTIAETRDGVRVEADNGRIGDRLYEFTRIVLSPEQVDIVMGWVPFVEAARLPDLIRRAHKGKLHAYVSEDRSEWLIHANQSDRVERLQNALTHHRNPRSWGF